MTNITSSGRIVIVTADSISRDVLAATLRCEHGLVIVGEASDEGELRALPRQLQPDILLLDSAMADLVDVAVSCWPGVRIILLATVIDDRHVMQALRLAARAIVPKAAPPQVLLKSIRSVLADQYWLETDSIAILVRMLRDLHPEFELDFGRRRHGLTAREHNIAAMIAKGHSNKQIGLELFISERTVKHHLTNIFGKLGLSSRVQLATFAVANRMASTADRGGARLAASSNTNGRVERKRFGAVSLIGG
jgi:DNA-binding NarL/FixJ family response regulator